MTNMVSLFLDECLVINGGSTSDIVIGTIGGAVGGALTGAVVGATAGTDGYLHRREIK